MSTKQRRPTSKEGSVGGVAVKPKPSPPRADVLITKLSSKASMFEEIVQNIQLERTAMVRIRMPGGVGGKAREGLPIPITSTVRSLISRTSIFNC